VGENSNMKLDKREIRRIVIELISAVTLFYIGVFFEKHTKEPPPKLNIIKVDTIIKRDTAHKQNAKIIIDSLKKYMTKADAANYSRHKDELFAAYQRLLDIKVTDGENSNEYKVASKELDDIAGKYFSKYIVVINDSGRTKRDLFFLDGQIIDVPLSDKE
jgi:hypothetical protein